MENFDDTHNPVPVILSILSGIANSDKVLEIVQQSGISIDLTLNSKENFSHLTRIRAYIPRIEKVFQQSPTEEALHTLTVTSGTIIQHYPEKRQEIIDKLTPIGWEYSEAGVLPASGDVAELYFTKGLEHTAFIELREIIGSANNSITIIDQWLDDSIFEYLKKLNSDHQYKTYIITSKRSMDNISFEAGKFTREYSHINILLFDSNEFHDRFVVVDDNKLYHLGASIKDTGKKVSIISKIETKEIIDSIILKAKTIIGET